LSHGLQGGADRAGSLAPLLCSLLLRLEISGLSSCLRAVRVGASRLDSIHLDESLRALVGQLLVGQPQTTLAKFAMYAPSTTSLNTRPQDCSTLVLPTSTV
jgi:hypothetical protein